MLERGEVKVSRHVLRGGSGSNPVSLLDTIKGYPLNEESIRNAFEDILQVVVNDDISFVIKSIGLIREKDNYGGFRVTLEAIFEELTVPLKVDVTTGDKITPREVSYRFELMFKKRYIEIFAYNLETIMSEKLETILSRGILNTRPRDYYDVYILTKLQPQNINRTLLFKALEFTCINRGTSQILEHPTEIIKELSESSELKRRWKLYQKEHLYAEEIHYEDVVQCIRSYFE